MTDTFGPSSIASSLHGSLSECLANRLRARTDLLGSTLFTLTWKQRVTPSGRSIPALRASGRRTSGSGFTSWPIPNHNTTGAGNQGRDGGFNLQTAAILASWPTPNTPSGGRSVSIDKMDATGRTADGRKHTASLEHAVKFATWATPAARDYKDGACDLDRNPVNKLLGREVLLTASGPTPSGSPASTEKRGQLNPEFSRWLMGLPPEWDACAPTATRSSLRKRRSS